MEVESNSRLSVPANCLEDEFASKITLAPTNSFTDESDLETTSLDDGWWDKMDEEYWLQVEVCLFLLLNCLADLGSHVRTVTMNGQKVEKPAKRWSIYLNDGPPEGCTQMAYHLDILKQVVGSDASEVYESKGVDTVFLAILTNEECGKLSGLKQVSYVLDGNFLM
ncbi:uncharacterized protein LOC141656255 isoform X2 [Silene latifolia]|uniref:uncharacterized protein LOC141656255 isoform X2 n=1 Tax=Silene latifolia TaxID=37657 RepID=UPI003D77C594